MRERRAPEPDETAARGPRTTARVLSALLSAAAVGIGAWFALRRRRPALPAFADEARPASPLRPAPRTTAAPPTSPPPAPARQPEATPEPSATPEPEATPEPGSSDDAAPPPGPAAPDPVATGPRGEALLAVSGIGRRTAAALAAAGITDLRALADTDTDTLAAALEAVGLRRSPTLATWPAQARRLLEG